jgi:glycosyltransferase involved in cell wall biosynthesis
VEADVSHDTPLVSIGIPTFNRAARYLPQSLESALGQTLADLEVIVSDNCSGDNTEELVTAYRRGDHRLRYFRQARNIGPNANANFCLSRARGKYFLLLHDDDLIDPDFLEACLSAGRRSPDAGVIRTGTRVIDEEGRVLWERPNQAGGLPVEEFFRCWFADRTSWYLASTLFDAKRLQAIGGFASRHHLAEDCVALATLASRHERVDVAEIKASFRKHPGEVTFAVRAVEWGEDFLELLELMCLLVPPAKAALVRAEGRRFFARLTYNRARSITAPMQRLRAYFEVCRLFDYRHFPVQLRSLPASRLARRIGRRIGRLAR